MQDTATICKHFKPIFENYNGTNEDEIILFIDDNLIKYVTNLAYNRYTSSTLPKYMNAYDYLTYSNYPDTSDVQYIHKDIPIDKLVFVNNIVAYQLIDSNVTRYMFMPLTRGFMVEQLYDYYKEL